MSESKTYVFGNEGATSNSGILGFLAPFLSRQGVDPNLLATLMNNRNGGFGGEGGWFIWIIFLFFLMGWNRNGWGNNNGNGNGYDGAGLANLINNDTGRDLLMQAIQGNSNALSQLSTNLNCSIGQVQQAIVNLMTQLCEVGNKVGQSSLQVINALQQGKMEIASQLASCCCDVRESITRQGYENQLATLNQTNALQGNINTVNNSVERGFASTAYETAQQTCDLKNAISEQTTFINDKFCQLEMREMQNKIDALRTENQNLKFAESQQAQNNYLISQLQPVARPCYLTCSPYQAAQFPYGFPYGGYPYGYPYGNNGYNQANNGGCQCGVGY